MATFGPGIEQTIVHRQTPTGDAGAFRATPPPASSPSMFDHGSGGVPRYCIDGARKRSPPKGGGYARRGTQV